MGSTPSWIVLPKYRNVVIEWKFVLKMQILPIIFLWYSQDIYLDFPKYISQKEETQVVNVWGIYDVFKYIDTKVCCKIWHCKNTSH